MRGRHDPYGEEYGDWEDPYVHIFTTMCTGCSMCVTWTHKLYDEIRSERIALVLSRRVREAGEPTCKQVAREDRDHWSDVYSQGA